MNEEKSNFFSCGLIGCGMGFFGATVLYASLGLINDNPYAYLKDVNSTKAIVTQNRNGGEQRVFLEQEDGSYLRSDLVKSLKAKQEASELDSLVEQLKQQ